MPRITRLGRFAFTVPVALLATTLAATSAGAAGRACLPEVDDEVIVLFQPGALSDPVVIGALWNGVDAPPPERTTGRATAPRVLAKALLDAIPTGDVKRDASAGSVARWLTETTAAELAALLVALEAVYQAGFVESAKSEAALEQLGFVAALVEGTFAAIVDASIQQMEDYAELVGSVSRNLDAQLARPTDAREDELLRLAAMLLELEIEIRDGEGDPDCED